MKFVGGHYIQIQNEDYSTKPRSKLYAGISLSKFKAHIPGGHTGAGVVVGSRQSGYLPTCPTQWRIYINKSVGMGSSRCVMYIHHTSLNKKEKAV